MLIQITDSQLKIFPHYKTLSYFGVTKYEPELKILNIKVLDCEKDLSNFDYLGKMTGENEITIILKTSHYQDLINLHLSKNKPDKMYIKFKKNYVSYYGFSC